MNIIGWLVGTLFGSIDVTREVGTFDVSYGFIPTVAMFAYLIVMDVKYGATLGKMVFKLKVRNAETCENLTWGYAILRETVGRFLASILFLLGYFWMLWDDKKQGWHDKLAKSVVVRVEK